LTLFAEDSHAKTSALQEKEQDLKAKDQVSGQSSKGSSKKSNRSTQSLKTSQPFDLEDWIKFSGKSLRSGMMQNGTVSPLPPLVRLTDGIESGSWPTPTVQDGGKATKRWREDHQNNLTAAVFNPHKMFPTPTSRDWKGGYRTESLIRKDGKSRAMDALPNAVLDGAGVETVSGHLNPAWVEWLMGFPVGWTDLNN